MVQKTGYLLPKVCNVTSVRGAATTPDISVAESKMNQERLEERRKRNRDFSARKYVERRKAIDAIKTAAGCVDCGYNLHPEALAFDHRDRQAKKFKIAAGVACRKWSKLLLEISKCDVRCHNCHAIKTVENKECIGRPRL